MSFRELRSKTRLSCSNSHHVLRSETPFSFALWWLKLLPGVVQNHVRFFARENSSLSWIVAHPSDGMSNNQPFIQCLVLKHYNVLKKQHCTVDHLARGSMKNAANCESECELQDI